MSLTYLIKVPDLLALNHLSVHMLVLLIVCHTMASLLHLYKWQIVIGSLCRACFETADGAADQTHKQLVVPLAFRCLAGARLFRALVVAAERASHILAVL